MERVCAPFLYTLFHRMLLSAMMMFANFVNFANFAMEFLALSWDVIYDDDVGDDVCQLCQLCQLCHGIFGTPFQSERLGRMLL